MGRLDGGVFNIVQHQLECSKNFPKCRQTEIQKVVQLPNKINYKETANLNLIQGMIIDDNVISFALISI